MGSTTTRADPLYSPFPAGRLTRNGDSMERIDRLIRLALIRGDRAALLILRAQRRSVPYRWEDDYAISTGWTEAERRMAWGDR